MVSPGTSITDSQIQNCNKIIIAISSLSPTALNSEKTTVKIWEIGSQPGVSFKGNVETLVGKFREMEEIDITENFDSRTQSHF